PSSPSTSSPRPPRTSSTSATPRFAAATPPPACGRLSPFPTAPRVDPMAVDEDHIVERMLGGAPGVEALGRGPAMNGKQPEQQDYHHPAAGWGAVRSVVRV